MKPQNASPVVLIANDRTPSRDNRALNPSPLDWRSFRPFFARLRLLPQESGDIILGYLR